MADYRFTTASGASYHFLDVKDVAGGEEGHLRRLTPDIEMYTRGVRGTVLHDGVHARVLGNGLVEGERATFALANGDVMHTTPVQTITVLKEDSDG